MPPRQFHWYPDALAVVKLPRETSLADLETGALFSLTRTPTELSLVVPEASVPGSATEVSAGWRAFAVVGPLDFSLVGILAELATALAEAGVSVFAVSTYDTDLVLVEAGYVERAETALLALGWTVVVR